jgi:hypothetical protein
MLIAGFHDVNFAGSVKRTTPCRITRTLAASAIVIDDTLTAVRARLLEIAHLILSVSGPLLNVSRSQIRHGRSTRGVSETAHNRPGASEIPASGSGIGKSRTVWAEPSDQHACSLFDDPTTSSTR